jgi:hypothetical protein
MYYRLGGLAMCSPANFDSIRKLVYQVNSELSILPFVERVERAREALRIIYTSYCTENGYIKVIFTNRYGERHVTRVKIYIDYTGAFKPILAIEYPYLIPK